jgi:hypothetical protein
MVILEGYRLLVQEAVVVQEQVFLVVEQLFVDLLL